MRIMIPSEYEAKLKALSDVLVVDKGEISIGGNLDLENVHVNGTFDTDGPASFEGPVISRSAPFLGPINPYPKGKWERGLVPFRTNNYKLRLDKGFPFLNDFDIEGTFDSNCNLTRDGCRLFIFLPTRNGGGRMRGIHIPKRMQGMGAIKYPADKHAVRARSRPLNISSIITDFSDLWCSEEASSGSTTEIAQMKGAIDHRANGYHVDFRSGKGQSFRVLLNHGASDGYSLFKNEPTSSGYSAMVTAVIRIGKLMPRKPWNTERPDGYITIYNRDRAMLIVWQKTNVNYGQGEGKTALLTYFTMI